MSLSHRQVGLVSHKWYAQHTGFLIYNSFFPLWILLHGLQEALLLEEGFCLPQFYVIWGIHMLMDAFNTYTHIYIYRHVHRRQIQKLLACIKA